jgi:hypothetical protein
MSPDQLREALLMVRDWPAPVQIHITGGEPFLKFDLLLEAVGLATELGIPRYVETNAGWCVSEELVRQRLVALRDAGLQALLISCSPFHAETIPPVRTRLALTTALEILGPGRVSLYLPEWLARIERFGVHKPTPLERHIELFGPEEAGWLFWQNYGLISGGRSGYRLGHLTTRRPPAAFRGQNCRSEILYAHHSHMDLYGNYISGFCGGLTAGDWHDLPQLRAEFESGYYPPLLMRLIQAGPYGLLHMAQDSYGYEPLAGGYAGKCHFCVDIRRNLVNQDGFSELRPKEFYIAF